MENGTDSAFHPARTLGMSLYHQLIPSTTVKLVTGKNNTVFRLCAALFFYRHSKRAVLPLRISARFYAALHVQPYGCVGKPFVLAVINIDHDVG